MLWDRLNSGVKITVRLPYKHQGKTATVEVDKNNYLGMTFAPVSYGGDGKYIEGVDCALDWGHDDLWTDDLRVWDAPPVPFGDSENMEEKIGDSPGDEKTGDGPLIDAKNEDLNYGRAVPGNRGWWPVGIIEWKGMVRHLGLEKFGTDWRSAMFGGKCKAMCVCVHQMNDGKTTMEAWAVQVRSRL